MKQRLAILGSTGSIGVQTLDIVRETPSLFEVRVLTANRNWQRLAAQAREFDADTAVIADERYYVQQREALADALYSVFTASGAKTLSDLNEEKLKSAAAMLKTYKNLARETRRMVTEALMLFFRLSTKSFVLDTQEESSREIENIRRKISEQYQKLLERKK